MTVSYPTNTLRTLPGLRVGERRWLLGAGDLIIIIASALATLWIWSWADSRTLSWSFVEARWPWLVALPGAWLLISIGLFDLYRSPTPVGAEREVLGVAMVAGLIYLVVFFTAEPNTLPRMAVAYFLVLAAGLTLGWRWAYVRLFALPYFQRRLLVVGAGQAGHDIIEALQSEPQDHYTVVGIIDDDASKHGDFIYGVRVLGGHNRLGTAIEALAVSDIVLGINIDLQPAMFRALLDTQARGVPIIRMHGLYEELTGRVPLEHLNSDWLTGPVTATHLSHRLFQAAKRLWDIAAAMVGLTALAAIFPVIALAIWLNDRGPVLYHQVRMGRHGRTFTLTKFRTMRTDAERQGTPRWAKANDDRVTSIGRFLRMTRLDETPQFWNVLKGEMSLIGPRPERPEFTAHLEREIPLFRARLLVKPGITGWAQVNYGYASTAAEAARKLQWDLYYIKHMSPWLDLIIAIKTIAVVLRLKGT